MWSNIAPALGLPATLPASFTYLGNKLEYQSSLSYNAHNFADKKIVYNYWFNGSYLKYNTIYFHSN
ncbi:MAG: hypothetical protein SPJ62_11730 [Inconstantimicrobium porci]|nr:hypothetical protein [Inconstantimicrobium porci]MDY5912646.1 hypothetical protein [Inconstantimicrobium porci]